MSLIITFYVGPATDVAAATRQDPSRVSVAFESLDVSVSISGGDGLTLDDLNVACRVLGEMRSLPSRSFKSYVGEVLDGTKTEGQVLRLKKTFLPLFGTLTETEARALSDQVRRQRFENAKKFYERRVRRASRIIQSRFDYVAFAILPFFLWLIWHSALATIAVTAAFVFICVVILPWWRRRKYRPPQMLSYDYAADFLRLAALCRKAEQDKTDLVYEWSL